MNKKTPDILIVGAGPAGIAAAIQLKRYGLAPTILEKKAIGGLLRNANLVENYPGFPEGISGRDLITLFEKQLYRFGVVVNYDEVLKVTYVNGWRVETHRTMYRPAILILATGTKSKPYPVVIPDQVQERVFNEVWPLVDMQNKHIVIIGAGDAAFDYALNLSRRNKVTILNRGTNTSCLPLLRERATENLNIVYKSGCNVKSIEEGFDGRLHIVCSSGDPELVECDYIVFAIGRDPQLDILVESATLQERTLLECGRMYLVGDVHNGLFRQTAIAVGEGLHAAMQIYANRGVI